MIKLLPGEDILLFKEWVKNIHPQDRNYTNKLERSVAIWLANGIISFQEGEICEEPFKPLSYLIGTDRHAISYIDSLVELQTTLENLKVKNSQEKSFLIGSFYSKGVAKSIEIIVNKIKKEGFQKEKYFWALNDSLTLIQAIKPEGGDVSVYNAWISLKNKRENFFRELKESKLLKLKHSFVLTSYFYCNPRNEKIKKIIKDIESGTISNSGILKNDIEACKRRLYS